MASILYMPSVAANASTAVLSEWVVQEGATFDEGAVLAMIETEKAVVELFAEAAGVMGRRLVDSGEELEVGSPIAVLVQDGEGRQEIENALATLGTEPSIDEQLAASPSASNTALADAGGGTVADMARIFASPLARRLAQQNGLELDSIAGSGPSGRIVKKDVARALQEKAVESTHSTKLTEARSASSRPGSGAPPAERATSPASDSAYRKVRHSNMRKAIARRLSESKATIPHYYLTQTFQVERLIALREDINAQHVGGRRLSVNDFIIRAVAVSLRDVPAANVRWRDGDMLHFDHADIGVAVSTDEGLFTPIIRAADTKSVSTISTEMADLVVRARANALKPEEYQGGSFGISNLGMYGIESFSAIINPPQAAILAVGAAEQAPVIVDGQVVATTLMRATLSVDHRAIDGAVAAQWMQSLKHYLEHPLTMLV